MSAHVDNHSHILLAAINEMVAAARSRKVAKLSITEHVSQFKEVRDSVRFGSVHTSGRMFRNLKEYTDEFLNIDKTVQGVKVGQGLEVDFSPRFEKKFTEFVNQTKWDILLCSVHEFDDAKDIEKAASQNIREEEASARWRDYFQLQKLALESDFVPFHVLAHPVRFSRGSAPVPPDINSLLLDLANTAKRKGKALELNGNDLRYAPKLVRKLAAACGKTRCRVSLGSDAHQPAEVFRNLDVAEGLVQQYELDMLL